ncbi:hypothetical protein ACW23B_11455 [Streptomyces albidoflavus]
MRQLFRALGAFTVSVLAVGALTSCGLGPGQRYEDESALTGADKITSVRLENDSGSVKVNGVEDDASTPYKLHRELDYRGERPRAPPTGSRTASWSSAMAATAARSVTPSTRRPGRSAGRSPTGRSGWRGSGRSR